MIRLCIFDMGGVVIRNHNVTPQLMAWLGRQENSFAEIDSRLADAIHRHGRGEISEKEIWDLYTLCTGERPPDSQQSLFGKFFTPRLHDPTLRILEQLKSSGMRIVCGTNVIDSHYKIHLRNGDYAVFDEVYPSHLMGISKPDPEFYRRILESEQVQPGEVFFTDDLKENVEAASLIGVHAVLYTCAEDLLQQLISLKILDERNTKTASGE